MHLYDARVDHFIPHATAGQIADTLRTRFRDRLDQNPSESEVRSWEQSLGSFADAITGKGLDESWIILEYQLPLASTRIDCMVVGTERDSKGNAVLLEFKQWDRCRPTRVQGVIDLGGIEHLHPSAQVQAYRNYLRDTHPAFEDSVVGLSSCAFLHNVREEVGSGFYDPQYADLLRDSPAFTAQSVEGMCQYVADRTYDGAPRELIDTILRAQYRPSKALLDHVASSIESYEPWQLLDVQLLTYNKILAEIEQARRTGQKKVIVITGGPGTGKSVIAIQVVGEAARRRYNVAHATGSKAFTTNLRGIIRREAPFRYTHNFRDTLPDAVDLVVCDEAHRLRIKTQFGARMYSSRPQAEEIMDAAKVAVFLLDQQQSVRANEAGSVWAIQNYAESQGIPVSRYDLDTQFRCAGSDSYIRWVEYAFGLASEPSTAWLRNNDYEVRIFTDVAEMEVALRTRRDEVNSARMVAGFCWEWSDPRPDGSLVPDVVIEDWKRPWNAKPPEMWKQRKTTPKPEHHPYTIWANEPGGFNEVGCIYSAQGFEFDYVGVIVARDLLWDPDRNVWKANLAASKDSAGKSGLTHDPKLALEKLAHTYRVLSTRGMKGTYFYFLDDATRKHFENLLR